MKKLFFLLAFMGMFTAAQAQCAKSAAAKKSCSKTEKAQCEATKAAAAKAASMDPAIQMHEDAETGAVSYVRKYTCEKSGETTYAAVKYDKATSKFVNLDAEKKSCDPAACSKKGKKGKATKVAAKGADKKSCDPADCAKKCKKGKKKAKKSAKSAKLSEEAAASSRVVKQSSKG